MGFTQTSEGRVFFKNANNDDTPASTEQTVGNTITKTQPAKPQNQGAVLPKDSTQMQILMLLKSLNTKLKSSKTDQKNLKNELIEYKTTIKELEKKTASQETNYIDLEQKISRKQNETSKKASRVEDSVKTTLEQLEQAKTLVQALEDKSKGYDTDLGDLKDKLNKQRQKEEALLKRQTTLETQQKEQSEKMVNNVAAYVALTKRVGETETRQESLDNKIEDSRNDYLKLDRKIDKAIEDRNRILRKVEHIEQAVLETRDALNAKAMVLLTDRGGVAGIHMPQITDDMSQLDPMAIGRRMEEEALLPWWRKPVRIQTTSFVLLLLVVLMAGWLLNQALLSSSNNTAAIDATKPRVSLYEPTQKDIQDYESATLVSPPSAPPPLQDPLVTQAPQQNVQNNGIVTGTAFDEYEKEMARKTEQETVLDINNEAKMLEAFNEDPSQVAAMLNQIEPGSVPEDLKASDSYEPIITPPSKAPPPVATPAVVSPAVAPPPETAPIPADNATYKTALRTRISPDQNLTDIAKKIEAKAFDGVPEAQHDMGAIYVAGHGQIKQNLDRAVLWFTEAANNGVVNAKYNLGVLYHQGIGVPESIDRAMELYREAARLGHPEAQYNLGIASIEGIGVAYNPKRAAAYFESAATSGITEAAYNLGLIYENGLLGESRPDEALSWYKLAADQGSPEAQSALNQLTNSLGITMDDVERIITRVRAEQPYKGAQANLDAEKQLVSQIQTELMRRGLYPGPIDGMTGPMTENAIKTFQSAAQLEANGHPSQELLGYLRASYN